MANESVQDVEAGRELDALIAERIFGLEVVWLWPGQRREEQNPATPTGRTCNGGRDRIVDDIPHYSTDISAAWEVMLNLCRRGLYPGVATGGQEEVVWTCTVSLNAGEWEEGARYATARAESAPLAICLAALKAVEATSSSAQADTINPLAATPVGADG